MTPEEMRYIELKHNECKGCLSLYEETCSHGFDLNTPDKKTCPCVNCIVKIMCEEPCQKFIDYQRKYSIFQGDLCLTNVKDV